MVEPLSLAVKLVNGLVESLEEVRTNREDCELLVRRATRTLVLLNHIQNRMVSDEAVLVAVNDVNEALKRAQDAIDNYCNTGCLCAFLLRKEHSLALYRADKSLSDALFQIPLACLGMVSDIQDNLATSIDGKRYDKFNEKAARTQQTETLRKEIKEVRDQLNQGFEESSAKTHQAIEENVSQTIQEIGAATAETSRVIKEAYVQTNQQIEGIKNHIEQTMRTMGLQFDKRGVLIVTTILAKDIAETSAKAKTNKEGCMLSARLVEQTLRLFEKLDENVLSNSLMLDALRQVNKAIVNVKHSVDDCSDTNVFHGAIFHERYSLRLKESMTTLGNALNESSHLLHGVSLPIQSALLCLCKEIQDANFDRSALIRGDSILPEEANDFEEALQRTQISDGQFPLHSGVPTNSIVRIKVDWPSNIT